MTRLVQRHTPMTEMLDWLESNNPWNFRGFGLLPYVRIEDYVEDDTFVRAELPGINPLSSRARSLSRRGAARRT